MIQFVLRRLLLSVPVIFGIIFLVFALTRLLPGDPCRAALGERATAAICDALRIALGWTSRSRSSSSATWGSWRPATWATHCDRAGRSQPSWSSACR
jgi:ABC-type dipeptide/oligopeptide/nickel transport system permease component